jgi:hypothetical protein
MGGEGGIGGTMGGDGSAWHAVEPREVPFGVTHCGGQANGRSDRLTQENNRRCDSRALESRFHLRGLSLARLPMEVKQGIRRGHERRSHSHSSSH